MTRFWCKALETSIRPALNLQINHDFFRFYRASAHSNRKAPMVADCYETLGPAKNKCEDALAGAGAFFMGFMQGEGRTQGALFPVTLEELIPGDHVCRVIDVFVGRLDMAALGFERAEAAETGRPGYDPRDLLKLYLYGYLQQIRSSRRLEAECRRNIELMWLLGRSGAGS